MIGSLYISCVSVKSISLGDLGVPPLSCVLASILENVLSLSVVVPTSGGVQPGPTVSIKSLGSLVSTAAPGVRNTEFILLEYSPLPYFTLVLTVILERELAAKGPNLKLAVSPGPGRSLTSKYLQGSSLPCLW